jgi:biotin-(acetyl-CoA carboxylase) ligase
MRRCSTLGQRVTIRMADRVIIGRAESLNEDGALLVRTDHGRLEHIIGGDVSLAKGSTP